MRPRAKASAPDVEPPGGAAQTQLTPTHTLPIRSSFACVEVPTFILSLGSIFPQHRSDLLFGVTFGVTRLFFYGLGFLTYLFTTAPIVHPLLVLLPGAAAMGMHIQWFSKWVKGQQSRGSKAAAAENAAPSAGAALSRGGSSGGGGGGGAAAATTGAGAIAERSSPAPAYRERTPTLESLGGVAPASPQPPEPKIHAPPAGPGVAYSLAAAKTLRPPAPRKTN